MNSTRSGQVDTKSKILQVAKELFAKSGFAGTSIREIALQADVNLASINYHFKTKEFLYWKVFEDNYMTVKLGIEKCGKKTTTTAELTLAVYGLFLSKDDAIMNIFKMFLTERVSIPSEYFEELEKKESIGPPGSEVFLEKIEQDIGDKVSTASKEWAVKMIFSLLVHYGVIMNTEIMKKRCKKDECFSEATLQQYLVHSVNAHLQYIKDNPKLNFSN